MNERLLQFIWQFQYYNKHSLQTTSGEILQVVKPGTWNHHQGPDFSEATIRIANTTWVGNIEIHIRSSDWYRHHHETDNHYANIILHVVWEEDAPVYDRYGHLLPCIVLQGRIPLHLLERYAQMMSNTVKFPCHPFLPVLNELAWSAWKERIAAERLERKSAQVLGLFEQTNRHWEEVFWWLLAANFGIQVNAAHFQLMAQSLPLPVLARHQSNLLQLEALLLGQANLLSGNYTEEYAVQLQKEYHFLKTKYQLQPIHGQPVFLRMRPAAFPTVRLAQLAMLLSGSAHLFSIIKEVSIFTELLHLFAITAGSYWHTHYRIDEPSVYLPKQLGTGMAENIVINTVIPVLFAYGSYVGEEQYKNKAIQWLYQLPPEHNRITHQWQGTGITNHSALDSQSLIELTNHYCTHKRCIDCAVGNKILKS